MCVYLCCSTYIQIHIYICRQGPDDMNSANHVRSNCHTDTTNLHSIVLDPKQLASLDMIGCQYLNSLFKQYQLGLSVFDIQCMFKCVSCLPVISTEGVLHINFSELPLICKFDINVAPDNSGDWEQLGSNILTSFSNWMANYDTRSSVPSIVEKVNAPHPYIQPASLTDVDVVR